MAAKIVTLIAFSLIAAGLAGFGLSEIMPNDASSEVNLNDFSHESDTTEFSQERRLVIPSSSTLVNP